MQDHLLTNVSLQTEGRIEVDLIVVVILAVALTSCATIPTPQEASDAVLLLRKFDAWAWAVGVALIWADLVLAIPQTVVITALGIIYGTFLGGLLGCVGLITSGLHRTGAFNADILKGPPACQR